MRYAVLGVLLAAMGCAKPGDGPKGEVKPAPMPLREPLPGRHDLQEVAQAFNSNEARAEAKYANRRFIVDASVFKVEKTSSGEYAVRFEWFVDGFNFKEGNAVAYFPSSEAEKLAPLDYRSPIAFEGRCDGLERRQIYKIVTFRECRIAPYRK